MIMSFGLACVFDLSVFNKLAKISVFQEQKTHFDRAYSFEMPIKTKTQKHKNKDGSTEAGAIPLFQNRVVFFLMRSHHQL